MGLLGKDKSKIIAGAIDLVKGVRGMVDDSKFTTEEAVRMNTSLADKTSEFVGATLSENTERSVTRRRIAVFFIYFFCVLTLILIGLWKFDPKWADFALELIVKFNFPWAFIAVIGFFFGTYALKSYTGSKK